MRTREELENLINGSALFSIDRVKDPELFVAEERRFLNYLTELMKLVRNDHFDGIDTYEGNETIGYDVFVTAKDCIKSFEPKSGIFLNYFNRSLKNTLVKGKIKEAKYQKNILSGNSAVIGKDGGEDVEVFDLIAATKDSPEDEAVSADTVRYLVSLVNFVFQRLQDRTKALVSKLLTVRMIDALLTVLSAAELLKETAFVDSDILNTYINGGKLPTARQIAALHDTTEQQASRTINNFLEKLMGNDKFAEAYAYMKIGGVA